MINKSLTASALFAALALLVGAAQPARGADDFTLTIEPLYMFRSTANVPLTMQDTNDDREADILVMDTQDANFGWGPGVHFSLKKDTGAHAWEGGLIYLRHSGSAETPTIPGQQPYFAYLYPFNYDSGFQPGDAVNIEPFEDAWMHSVKTESSLWGLELNRIWKASERMHWLIGARILFLNDKLQFMSIDEDPGSAVDETGDLNVTTRNTLLGAQAGLAGTKPFGSSWRLSGMAKLGLYANLQKKNLDYLYLLGGATVADGGTYQDSQSGIRVSALLDAGANFGWLLSKTMTLSLGYTAMYITGIASAADQMPLANTDAEFSKYDTGGSILFHGVRLALDIQF